MNYIDPLYDWEGYEASKIETVHLLKSPANAARLLRSIKEADPEQAKPVAVSPEECERLWNLVIQASKN